MNWKRLWSTHAQTQKVKSRGEKKLVQALKAGGRQQELTEVCASRVPVQRFPYHNPLTASASDCYASAACVNSMGGGGWISEHCRDFSFAHTAIASFGSRPRSLLRLFSLTQLGRALGEDRAEKSSGLSSVNWRPCQIFHTVTNDQRFLSLFLYHSLDFKATVG